MNYPSGIKKCFQHQKNYSNRGMSLENDINCTNEYYLNSNIAVIYKKPTPITIVDVNYPSRRDAVITKAYFKTPSTTDYNGIYKGKYIDFEAKETTNLTSFPLCNIHKHQIEHLKRIYCHGGISFLIIRFSKLNLTFLLTYEKLDYFLNNYDKKSISLDFLKKHATQIHDKYNPRIDYLDIIDKMYFKGEFYEKEV
ncbi:MAG: Holliday junction resolvase RecU [Firmicutes bacterium]|nr:Holliday junction resolvase RecU [Bacillota bacterium]